ncbi:unnamed protein product [Prunus armeniaca]
MSNHLCRQIGQVGTAILVGQNYTKPSYPQTSKGNYGRRKLANHLCKHIGQMPEEWLSDNCVLRKSTCIYLRATGNEKTGQPQVHTNCASG